MIIDRNVINKDLILSEFLSDNSTIISHNYQQFCQLINQIKHTLLEKGAKKSDTVALIQHRINAFHIASVFAVCELGMQLLIVDFPASEESLPYCKMATYQPINFTLFDNISNPLVRKMVTEYSNIIITEKEISCKTNYIQPWEISSTDPLLITSSSGTTNWSKKVIFSHNEIYSISNRNIALCQYSEHDRVVQTKNLHHGASLIITLLPSLMKCPIHFAGMLPDISQTYKSIEQSFFEKLIKTINDNNYNRIMMTSKPILDLFLNTVANTIGKFKNKMIITTYVFTVTQELIDSCKKYNIEFISCFGSIDAKLIPLTANHITSNSIFIPNTIGKLFDSYYQVVDFTDGVFSFNNELWEEPRILGDKFEIQADGNIILKERLLDENKLIRDKTAQIVKTDFAVVQNGNKKYLALFDKNEPINNILFELDYSGILHIEKEPFFTEAKLNYDALRGHFIYYDNLGFFNK